MHASAVEAGVGELRTSGGAPCGHGAPGHIPVSYTHLRAHETALDLVCRLLLEKKTAGETDAVAVGEQSPLVSAPASTTQTSVIENQLDPE